MLEFINEDSKINNSLQTPKTHLRLNATYSYLLILWQKRELTRGGARGRWVRGEGKAGGGERTLRVKGLRVCHGSNYLHTMSLVAVVCLVRATLGHMGGVLGLELRMECEEKRKKKCNLWSVAHK